MTPREKLSALLTALEQIRDALPSDKRVWDSQPLLRLAIERMWITAGNLAEAYRLDKGVASGTEPWSELAGYRNLLAHALPGDISSDRVFADSSTDIERMRQEVLAKLGE